MEEHAPNTLKNLLVGIIVGVTSMLPGISGATMCVVFNVYERLVRDIAHLREYLRKDFRFIILLVIGAGIGIILCAKVLDSVLDRYPVEALMFFIGLIAGQLIPIYNDIKNEDTEKFNPKAILVFAFGFVIMMIMVAVDVLDHGQSVTVSHDALGIVLMFTVGVVIAVSALLPGLSHSTLLLVCGLMDAFIAVFSNLDFVLLIPMLAGIFGGAIVFSKIINNALEHHHFLTSVFILGLTAGSIIVIAVNVSNYSVGIVDMAAGVALLAIGFLMSVGSMKLGHKMGA